MDASPEAAAFRRLRRFGARRRFSPPFLCAPAILGTMTVRGTRGWPSWTRRVRLLLWQGVKLQASCCAPPLRRHFRVLPRFTYHARPRRAAGGAAGRDGGAAVWCCVPGVQLPRGEKRFDARRPPRTHSRAIFEPFTRSNVVRAAGNEARSVCWCSCHHTDRRLDFGLPRRALARRRCSQRNHDALHGAAAARVRV
jgi:hypothetical protein